MRGGGRGENERIDGHGLQQSPSGGERREPRRDTLAALACRVGYRDELDTRRPAEGRRVAALGDAAAADEPDADHV
jgi:hypothetical protein